QLLIYNRWGNLLFESNDTTAGWNGRFNGNEVEDGTYYYIINATDTDGKQYLLKDFVTLIR
ncbi:MAG: gliding motility-associated C-terminal domain-containing protein, partial [Bacteroidia bacterium]